MAWDPASKDWDSRPVSRTAIMRVQRDLRAIFNEPVAGICVVADAENAVKVHALITGPFETPYEGGIFHFFVRCPPDYPITPPRVKLMTTGQQKVRFNPNLYANGKVCLSIIGTWTGPRWSPALTLSSLLVSIQSLMGEKPYHNEPGYERERNPGDSKCYNDIIRHETVRVAVCDEISKCLSATSAMPPQLQLVAMQCFPHFHDYYIETCDKNMHLDGKPMRDPFNDRRPKFEYGTLKQRLQELKPQVLAWLKLHDPREKNGATSISTTSPVGTVPGSLFPTANASKIASDKLIADESSSSTTKEKNGENGIGNGDAEDAGFDGNSDLEDGFDVEAPTPPPPPPTSSKSPLLAASAEATVAVSSTSASTSMKT